LTQKKALLPFIAWLSCFYLGWIALVITGDYLHTVLNHWPMAVSMMFGSYVAGSTPMGGGAVGFPVLVLLMDLPATLGRDFSFAVQAVGMTSASIYILCQKQDLEWPMLRAALPGALLGTPLGILYVAPLASDLFIKLLFAAMWCSFGLLHLRRINEITSYVGMTPHDVGFDHKVGFIVGFLGSLTIASITGVGIDLMIYMVLVLWCHADLKIAIPTSVVLMAFTSLIGIVTKLLLGSVQPGTFENWLAAAPIVAIGAPFGAMVVSKIGRRPTLLIVSVLCVLQFFWTLVHEKESLTLWNLGATLLGLVLFLLVFQEMYQHGYRLARRQRSSATPVTEETPPG
jgi:uncharacterized membrane protein YfcA